jgi:hypothetical protein
MILFEVLFFFIENAGEPLLRNNPSKTKTCFLHGQPLPPNKEENMRQTEPKGSVIMKFFKSPVCSSKEWQVVPPLGLELVEAAMVFLKKTVAL